MIYFIRFCIAAYLKENRGDFKSYIEEVDAGTFPAKENCYTIDEDVIEKLY